MSAKPVDRESDIVVLLIEDSDGDARLVAEKMRLHRFRNYRLKRVTSMSEAREWFARNWADVVLLDINLSDSTGVDTVLAASALAGDAAIVVLTGQDDAELALQALDAGAQDYLSKEEVNARALQRILLFAVARRRSQLRQLQEQMSAYRNLAIDTGQGTPAVTPAAPGPLKSAQPELFAKLYADYGVLLQDYIDHLILKRNFSEENLRTMVAALGEAGAGPRDVLDIHVAALENAMEQGHPRQARYLNTDGRLLALQLMGLLVSYYRNGMLS